MFSAIADQRAKLKCFSNPSPKRNLSHIKIICDRKTVFFGRWNCGSAGTGAEDGSPAPTFVADGG
jgi:hypothetical protein